MGCGNILGRFPFVLRPTSTDLLWEPLGKSIVIVGSKAFDFALTINTLTGNAVAIPAVGLMAARPEAITAVNAASGSYSNSQTTTHHSTDTTGTTDKFLAQCGVLGKLSSGATPAYVAGYVSIIHRACGMVIGNREIEVDPNMTTGSPRYYLLGRVPASGGDKLRAALIGNVINDVDYLFYVRGVNDPDNPGSWTAIGTFTSFTNGAFAICTTDASISGVTPSSYHLLEFAVALRLKTAGAGPTGFLRVSAGLSYT